MRSFTSPALALLAPLFAVLAACGGGSQEMTPASAPKTPTLSTAPATAGAPLPPNVLRRSAVREVIAAGPGAFLGHVAVDVEHPVFLGGKFHGFRIQGLNDPSWWTGVDLRPGDVVTRVNGFTIEHPEDAAEAFASLAVASELHVSYERDGAPRELRYAIVDDTPARPAPPRNEVR